MIIHRKQLERHHAGLRMRNQLMVMRIIAYDASLIGVSACAEVAIDEMPKCDVGFASDLDR